MHLCKLDHDNYFMCNMEDFKFLANMIEHIPLPLRVRYVFCCAPISSTQTFVCNMFLKVNIHVELKVAFCIQQPKHMLCVLKRSILMRYKVVLIRYCFCFFCCFTSQVNSYGHCGMVSSPSHTFSWAGLNKRLTSNLCTYFRL